MKLVGYLRVSSIGQVTDGFGLEVQQEAIQRWADANGHEIVGWVEDPAVSGTTEAATRPGFNEALTLVVNGQAEGLVAYDMTRLARDLIVQEVALSILWQAGGSMFTTATGLIDPAAEATPAQTLIRQLLGALAQFDRASTVRRLSEGKARAKAAGKHVNGAYAFGRHPDRPEELRTLQLALQLYDAGHGPLHITNELNRRGLGPRRGTKWHETTLRRIIYRERPQRRQKEETEA